MRRLRYSRQGLCPRPDFGTCARAADASPAADSLARPSVHSRVELGVAGLKQDLHTGRTEHMDTAHESTEHSSTSTNDGLGIAHRFAMLRTFRLPLTWTELLSRTVKEASADDILGLAAQLAYYFLLSLVPAIVCLIALTSFLPQNTLQDMVASAARVAPPDIVNLLREQLMQISQGENGGVFTIGVLLALWSSSAAMVGIVTALNKAYDIEEGRPWWKVRLVAIALTLGVALFVIAAFVLVMFGPTLADRIAASVGLGSVFTITWKILQWPVAFALVTLCVGLVFYFAPDAEQDWEWITPGAVVATLLWMIASLAFKLYVANFADYNESYGSLGGVIVLMLWFYISALAVLAGAELNAEIEHASPHGKNPGEKVAGEKRKLGFAAKRAFEDRQAKGPSPASSGGTESDPKPPVDALLPVAKPGFAAYALLGVGIARKLAQKKA